MDGTSCRQSMVGFLAVSGPSSVRTGIIFSRWVLTRRLKRSIRFVFSNNTSSFKKPIEEEGKWFEIFLFREIRMLKRNCMQTSR